MSTTSVADRDKPVGEEIRKGRRLYAKVGSEIRFHRGVWEIPSEEDAGTIYEVIDRTGRCECPHTIYRQPVYCKHSVAAMLRRAKTVECDCCHERVEWGGARQVTEDDDLLAWFPGDVLCRQCADRGYWI